MKNHALVFHFELQLSILINIVSKSTKIIEEALTKESQNIHPSYRLDEKSYLKWFQLVRIFMNGKGRLNHVLGTKPKSGDPKFDVWDEEASMIMSWL